MEIIYVGLMKDLTEIVKGKDGCYTLSRQNIGVVMNHDEHKNKISKIILTLWSNSKKNSTLPQYNGSEGPESTGRTEDGVGEVVYGGTTESDSEIRRTGITDDYNL